MNFSSHSKIIVKWPVAYCHFRAYENERTTSKQDLEKHVHHLSSVLEVEEPVDLDQNPVGRKAILLTKVLYFRF